MPPRTRPDGRTVRLVALCVLEAAAGLAPAVSTLIAGIGLLVAADGERRNAALVIDGGIIAWIGDDPDAPAADDAHRRERRVRHPRIRRQPTVT